MAELYNDSRQSAPVPKAEPSKKQSSTTPPHKKISFCHRGLPLERTTGSFYELIVPLAEK